MSHEDLHALLEGLLNNPNFVDFTESFVRGASAIASDPQPEYLQRMHGIAALMQGELGPDHLSSVLKPFFPEHEAFVRELVAIATAHVQGEQLFQRVITDYYEVDYGQPLGKGGYGTVYRGTDLSNGHACAVKVINKSLTRGVDIKREITSLRALRHENIIQLIDVFDDGTHIYLITELFDGAITLLQYVLENNHCTEAQTRAIIKKLLEILVFIHGKGIVHRDLKPENVLIKVNPDGSVLLKIIDFGLSTPDGASTRLVGSAEFIAPEHFDDRLELGPEMDLWAIACMTYILLCAESPFHISVDEKGNDRPVPQFARLFNLQLPRYDGPLWSTDVISGQALAFVMTLLQRDPKARPTASEALQLDWMKMPIEHKRSAFRDKIILDKLCPWVGKFLKKKKY
eukprot:TRINITY_DN7341_c0_g1_i3.p1 TRINITY_DN7341_c0_g1~~TRINITY_DN7341_c0_g1_i3.p1  ORF type:complete len:401 (+),score=44.16 TRINITY_DN7341_c0_g1_i3:128-1330(+)